MGRILHIEVEECRECPVRVTKEMHGPCDSDYWAECTLKDGKEIPEYFEGKFPRWCPLEKVSTE